MFATATDHLHCHDDGGLLGFPASSYFLPFPPAAHQDADLRTRKATLSLAKLVLHLKTLQAPPLEMDHRHVTEVNNGVWLGRHDCHPARMVWARDTPRANPLRPRVGGVMWESFSKQFVVSCLHHPGS